MQVAERMQRNVVTVDREDPLALAVQLMGWSHFRHLPVVAGGRVVGMLSERDLLAHAHGDLRERVMGTVGDAMSSPVKIVPPSMDIAEAAAILVKERIDALPVIAVGRLVGVVTSTDVLGYVAQCALPPPLLEEPSVADVMTRRVEAVFSDDRLSYAAARMRQQAIRHLPVVDGTMRVLGILSDRDIERASGEEMLQLGWAERRRYASDLDVRDAMTRDPKTVFPDEPLSAAIRALVEAKIGAVLVVDEGWRLLGIISYVDLLGYLGRDLEAVVLPEAPALAARSPRDAG